MQLIDALEVSGNIRDALKPYCLRCEVAGSIRRGKESPGDIDLVVIPTNERPPLEFGQKEIFKTTLDARLNVLEKDGLLSKTAGGDKLKKYTLDATKWGWSVTLAVAAIAKMQITICTPETWGYWYAIRTGPADFSHWLVTPRSQGGAMPDGMYFKDCRLWPGPKETPEEADIFKVLGLLWSEPDQRQANWKR